MYDDKLHIRLGRKSVARNRNVKTEKVHFTREHTVLLPSLLSAKWASRWLVKGEDNVHPTKKTPPTEQAKQTEKGRTD